MILSSQQNHQYSAPRVSSHLRSNMVATREDYAGLPPKKRPARPASSKGPAASEGGKPTAAAPTGKEKEGGAAAAAKEGAKEKAAAPTAAAAAAAGTAKDEGRRTTDSIKGPSLPPGLGGAARGSRREEPARPERREERRREERGAAGTAQDGPPPGAQHGLHWVVKLPVHGAVVCRLLRQPQTFEFVCATAEQISSSDCLLSPAAVFLLQALAQPTSSSTLAAVLNCVVLPSSLPKQPQLVAASGSDGASAAGMSVRHARAAGQRSSSGVTRLRGSSQPLSQLAGSGRTASRRVCGLTLPPMCRARVSAPALAAHVQPRRLQLVSAMPSGRGARRWQRLQQAAGSASGRGSSVQPTSQLSVVAGSGPLAAAVMARRQLLQ